MTSYGSCTNAATTATMATTAITNAHPLPGWSRSGSGESQASGPATTIRCDVSTLIVTSVVVVYAAVTVAYVATSEQRAMRRGRRDRGDDLGGAGRVRDGERRELGELLPKAAQVRERVLAVEHW